MESGRGAPCFYMSTPLSQGSRMDLLSDGVKSLPIPHSNSIKGWGNCLAHVHGLPLCDYIQHLLLFSRGQTTSASSRRSYYVTINHRSSDKLSRASLEMWNVSLYKLIGYLTWKCAIFIPKLNTYLCIYSSQWRHCMWVRSCNEMLVFLLHSTSIWENFEGEKTTYIPSKLHRAGMLVSKSNIILVLVYAYICKFENLIHHISKRLLGRSLFR